LTNKDSAAEDAVAEDSAAAAAGLDVRIAQETDRSGAHRPASINCARFRGSAFPYPWYIRLLSASPFIGLHHIVRGILPGHHGALAHSWAVKR
jgi:hypothetical protein